ncbi:unnamed protein product [Sphagnum balticum]
MQIRARLQHHVPARRLKRTATQADDSDEEDTNRRRALDSMLTKQTNDTAEAAASETVMRVMAIAQSNQDESEEAQGGDNVDDDYATDAIWTTPVEDDNIDKSGTGGGVLLPAIAGVAAVNDVSDDLLADTVGSGETRYDMTDEILHDGSDDPVRF